MPSITTLRAFVDRVEQGAHAEAIEEFYADNALMHENQQAPRLGGDNLVRHEKGTDPNGGTGLPAMVWRPDRQRAVLL